MSEPPDLLNNNLQSLQLLWAVATSSQVYRVMNSNYYGILLQKRFTIIMNISEYILGFTSLNSTITKCINLGNSTAHSVMATFSDSEQNGHTQWRAYGQALGDPRHFESTKTYLDHDINVLQKPAIESIEYDTVSISLTITWTSASLKAH